MSAKSQCPLSTPLQHVFGNLVHRSLLTGTSTGTGTGTSTEYRVHCCAFLDKAIVTQDPNSGLKGLKGRTHHVFPFQMPAAATVSSTKPTLVSALSPTPSKSGWDGYLFNFAICGLSPLIVRAGYCAGIWLFPLGIRLCGCDDEMGHGLLYHPWNHGYFP
jgi:hypothetical protein